MKIRICLIAALFLIVGCEETIEVGNLDAEVTTIGPIEASGFVQFDEETQGFSQVRIRYTLRDYEGDDVAVSVEVCEEDAPDTCGAPFRGYGGDGVSRVPTAPFDSDVPHVFEWIAGCGRIVGDSVEPTDIEASYIARVRVRGTSGAPIVSQPFRLGDMGFEQDTMRCY